MEGTPLDTETDSEEGSDKKKSKKRDSVRLGSVATGKRPERAPREPSKVEKPDDSWWKPKETLPKPKPSHLAETEPVSEAKAPTDELSQEEKAAIAAEILDHSPVSKLEQSDDPDADPRAVAGDLAVEEWQELIIEQGKDPDAAEQIVRSKLGAEPEDQPQDFNNQGDFGRQPEAEADAIEAEDEDDYVGTTSSRPAGPSPAGNGQGGHNGPGGPPPDVLAPPAAPFGPLPLGGNPNIVSNLAPAPANTAPATQPYRMEQYDDGNAAGAALIGGIIGYLIGRRRGRIKTEKKLLPIQKKLETQVNDLQWELKAKEARIRKVAAQQVELRGPAVVEVFAASLAAERIVPERRRAPEAHLLHDEKPAPEHIGKVLVSAKALPRASRIEKEAGPGREGAEKIQLPPNKRVETLNRAELLSLSEKIVVNGSTLRQIYETHLVGERGLRRLVSEHLRGGDLKKALRHEIVEHEIDFERDPVLRDMAASSGASIRTSASSPTTALHQLLEKASSSLPADEEAAYFKARADYELKESQQQQKNRRIVDISLVTVIAVLLALVVVLYLTRR